MNVRRTGLLGTVAAGLLVSVAALPAVAVPATITSVPGGAVAETSGCTEARAAVETYRTGTVAPQAAELATRVTEVEELLLRLEVDVSAADEALEQAQEALTVADAAVLTAEAELATAQEGGDPDVIAAAQATLLAATAALDEAADGLDEAVDAADAVRSQQRGLQTELAETVGVSQLWTEVASGGRGIETPQQLAAHLMDLRAVGLDGYADLVEDLAAACFDFTGDEDEEGRAVPSARTATPVTARASYTG
ncbi:hypothetical protein [Aquipuribacter sp. MA13-6]|uniref:hypothetical protein n=1 Tax=unclassified Aquipuribacter TaxID=2635084 RepID=UPI003EEA3F13